MRKTIISLLLILPAIALAQNNRFGGRQFGGGVSGSGTVDSLAQIGDMNIGARTNGQSIQWEVATGKWIPLTVAGGGTVTSFSAGALSPLFTTSVATATTTPALSFALSNVSAGLVYAGPKTGAAAVPSFKQLKTAYADSAGADGFVTNNTIAGIIASEVDSAYVLGLKFVPRGAFTGNTETLITVTYQVADHTIDFVVDNNLANYSNASSKFFSHSDTTSTLATQFDLTSKQPLDADLTALAGNSTDGLWAHTGAGTGAARTLTGDTEIVVANGDGVAGNPTLSIASTLTRDTELASYLLKANFPDSLRENYRWRAAEASPAAGDTTLIIKAGVVKKIDIGDLPSGGSGDITAVGDVTSGAAFTGTAGDTLIFNNAGGDGIISYNGTDFIIDKSVALVGDGVRLSATDGKLTILGLGNGVDENIIFNFDDFSNAIDISSGTSATSVQFNELAFNTFRTGLAGTFRNMTDAASNEVLRIQGGARATPTDDDEALITFWLENDAQVLKQFTDFAGIGTDLTETTKDGAFEFRAFKNNVKSDLAFFGFSAAGAAVYQLHELTTDGFMKTTGSNGTLSIDATVYAPLASPTFTGTVTIPTPFTLGAVSVTPTGTELNFVDGVTSAIQTQLDAKGAHAGQTWTGTHDFGGAALEITNSDNPTGSATLPVSYDNNNDALEVFDAGRNDSYQISHIQERTMTVAFPDTFQADCATHIEVFRADDIKYPFGATVHKVAIQMEADVAYQVIFEEWTGDPIAQTAQIDTVATGAADTFAESNPITDTQIAADNTLMAELPTTNTDKVTIMVWWSINDGN